VTPAPAPFRRLVRLVKTALALLGLFHVLTPAASGGADAAPATGTIIRHDARLDALVPPGAVLEQVADGFTWVEGPVWDARHGRLLFTDIPRNAVLAWEEGRGARVFLQPSGYTGKAPFTGREPGANGLALDAKGRLVLCEHGDRRVTRLEADGRRTVLADRWQGKRLNSPNDVVLASNGDLWFTDPPFGLPKTFDDPGRELDFSGVYRLAPDGRLALVTRELRAPNGIALSPSGRTLYVSNADPARAVWMAWDLGADGTLGASRVFFDATPWTATRRGLPDGMAVDRAGNLFAAGPGGIHVFAPDATHLGTIALAVPTSNCAWGGDGSVLYVTADTAVWRIRLATRGA
jgi:gluconolactonase